MSNYLQFLFFYKKNTVQTSGRICYIGFVSYSFIEVRNNIISTKGNLG